MPDTQAGAAPLLLTPDVSRELDAVRRVAASKPVDMRDLAQAIRTPRGKRMHQARMNAQTVVIGGPWPFFVVFSIETGHPCGTCRHMSMSVQRHGRVPNQVAVWMVAELLGFSGGFEACRVWPELLSDGGTAINLIQPLAVQPTQKGSA